MNQSYPVPPPELVREWTSLANEEEGQEVWSSIATQSAQWGADQELQACCEWMRSAPFGLSLNTSGTQLRAARRPKPPTLNSIALQMLDTIERDAHYIPEITDTIRRALEQLPNAL